MSSHLHTAVILNGTHIITIAFAGCICNAKETIFFYLSTFINLADMQLSPQHIA
jgi:hypothetical protein